MFLSLQAHLSLRIACNKRMFVILSGVSSTRRNISIYTNIVILRKYLCVWIAFEILRA